MAVATLGAIRLGATLSGRVEPFVAVPPWASLATAALVLALSLALVLQVSRDGNQSQEGATPSQQTLRLSLLTQAAVFVMLLGVGSR